jgi:hypothetical protein
MSSCLSCEDFNELATRRKASVVLYSSMSKGKELIVGISNDLRSR